MELTHASFFSGVGGLDLGLEWAGWRTVSLSEIDPYASAVLAERWPGVPNLGDIVALASHERTSDNGRPIPNVADLAEQDGWGSRRVDGDDWQSAALWSGGFPCQDLSVAGKRAGMGLDHGAGRTQPEGGRDGNPDTQGIGTGGAPDARGSGVSVYGTRSGLAFAFLDILAATNAAGLGPDAVLLENVPGLLSSHRGRDMAALLGRLVELGYGVAYRVQDARFHGVPQRRRRVFILGLRSGPDDPDGHLAAERAAEVLSVGTRCERHPASGGKAGAGAAGGAGDGVDETRDILNTLTGGMANGLGFGVQDEAITIAGPPPDPGRVRATDGLAGRLDDREVVEEVSATRTAPVVKEGGRRDKVPVVVQALDQKRGGPDDNEAQAGHLVWTPIYDIDGSIAFYDPLLQPGLDSHRYRCCGNGVVAPVAEWIGRRLADYLLGLPG